MEALLEKEGKVENWNDDRLDELSQTMKEGFAKVDKRFERVEGEMKEGFAKIDRRFERVNDRLDKLFYTQIAFVTTLAIGLLADKISV